MTPNSYVNQIIVRQLVRHRLEYSVEPDPDQNGREVVYCYDVDWEYKVIFAECSDDELIFLFRALRQNLPLDWDVAVQIAKLLPEKGHLIKDELHLDECIANPFDGFNQLLLAFLGCDQIYENQIIALLDEIPEDARDGLFMACAKLDTSAIFCKLAEKFTEWITDDPDYGNGSGEGRYLDDFIMLWVKTQDAAQIEKFIDFCRKNWRNF